VAISGAWLAETGSSVAAYLEAIEQDRIGALSIEASRGLRVEATWDLSLQRLQARSPGAYRLLQLCSLLAPEIATELIYSDAFSAALRPYDPAGADKVMRGALVQQISRLALLRVDQRERRPGADWFDRTRGSQLVIHRVLQLVVRARMTPKELQDARHQVHLMLAAARPAGDVDDPDRWSAYRLLWPHLDVSGAARCSDESVRQLLIDRVRYNFIRGNPDLGRDLAEQFSANWSDQLASTEDPEQQQTLRRQLLQLRFNLANVLRDQGNFEESLKLDEAVLPQQEELLGERHPHTLMTAGSLAADLRGLGRYAEAMGPDERTHAAWLEEFGEDHPSTLSALNNLAVCYRLLGRIAEARELDEVAYQRRRVVLGDGHPYTLQSATNLGRDLRELGEYDRSVVLLTTVLDTATSVLGPGSRHALNAQANLAVSLRNVGRVIEAGALLDTALQQLTELVGANNPDTVACRLSRAVNLFELRRFDRAAEELTAVRDAYQRSLGRSHPHTLVCTSNLAAFARVKGEPREPLDLARVASENMIRVLGADHPYALATQMNLGVCAAEAGLIDEGLAQLAEAGAGLARTVGPDHPHTLRCQANHALIRRERNEPGASAELSGIIDRLAALVGANQWAVVALRESRLLVRIIDPHPF